MLLYLLRHGEAEASIESDRQRELTPRGSAESLAIARKLAEKLRLEAKASDGKAGSAVQKALVSPYVRARQTADNIRQEMPELAFEETDLLVPESSPLALIDYLETLSQDRVLMVGHNPLLSDVASILVNGRKDNSLVLGTSHLVCIAAEQLAPGHGNLQFQIMQ